MVEQPLWCKMIRDVVQGRVAKPRLSGLTMVIDVGMPITAMRDILQLAGDHIDFWKFGFGSAAVCPAERMLDKVTLCQEYDVLAYPGGTSLEIMFWQGEWQQYLKSLWDSGVRVVEVSDGTINLPLRKRREMIRYAKKMGFKVLSEVGKKLVSGAPNPADFAQLVQGDIAAGASYVIVEGRESGIDTGVYDADGNVMEDAAQALNDAVGPYQTRLIWEAPLRKQQVYYMTTYGSQVNLGNIRVEDIVSVECLRRGLRSDTMGPALGISANEAHVTGPGIAVDDLAPHHEPRSGPTLWKEARSGPIKKRG